MTVFKTLLKIINKNKGMILLYTGIILSITLVNQTSGNTNMVEFEETKPSILIISDDNINGISKGLKDYLESKSKKVEIDINKKDAINDAIFYRDVNYVLYLDNDLNKDINKGITPKINYKSSGDYYASYTEMLIKKYIKTALIYKDYYNDNELIEKINDVVNKDVNVEIKTTLNTSKLGDMTRYFNFLNYAFLAGCVYCISMVLSSLKEKNVNKRTIISSYSIKKLSRITLLTNSLLVFVMWLLYMIISIVLFKSDMFTTNGIWYMINSFIYSICALAIGTLIGTITQNKNAIGGIVNVVALGTCFLCGCFVPFEYMPESVISIARFLPTYYFVKSNETIRYMEVFNIETLKPILINFGIILLFTIIFIILINVINKKKQTIN